MTPFNSDLPLWLVSIFSPVVNGGAQKFFCFCWSTLFVLFLPATQKLRWDLHSEAMTGLGGCIHICIQDNIINQRLRSKCRGDGERGRKSGGCLFVLSAAWLAESNGRWQTLFLGGFLCSYTSLSLSACPNCGKSGVGLAQICCASFYVKLFTGLHFFGLRFGSPGCCILFII